MGMGEPLLNYRNVVTALRVMIEGFKLPRCVFLGEINRTDPLTQLCRQRVTVSTAGIVPNILKLKKDVDCALALSLHAPTEQLRSVSLNRCERCCKQELKEIS